MSAAIHLVYPANGHRTYESATFVMGRGPVNGPLTLQHGENKTTIPVEPDGAFSQQINLSPGTNTLILSAPGCPPVSIQVTRESFSLQPNSQGFFEGYWPLGDIAAGIAGLSLPIACLTTASVKTLSAQWQTSTGQTVGPLVALHPRVESPAPGGFHETRTAIFGQPYWDHAPIPAKYPLWEGEAPLPNHTTGPVKLCFTATTSAGTVSSWIPPFHATVWSQPRLATLTANPAICRTYPVTGARLTPLSQGVKVCVSGHWQGWAAIELEPHMSGYVALKDLALSSESGPLAPVLLTTLQTHQTADQLVLTSPLPHPVPAHVEAHPHKFSVTLYGVRSALDFIRQPASPPNDSPPLVLEALSSHAVRLGLSSPKTICGWSQRFIPASNQWELKIKTLPADFRQWRIALDPGHGGTETGGIALDGTPEKTLNLQLAQAVAQLLKAAGFTQVIFTRTQDEALSLAERAQRVQASGAHLCLSLHHNALPDGRDPRAHQGAGVYYYHPMSWPLANALQQQLILKTADDQVWYNNLAMTRLPGCLSVLIEAGFMTHPVEGMRVLSATFRQQVGQAVADGLLQLAHLMA